MRSIIDSAYPYEEINDYLRQHILSIMDNVCHTWNYYDWINELAERIDCPIIVYIGIAGRCSTPGITQQRYCNSGSITG